MRPTISDKAIVLGRTDYGERDRILTLLTSDNGNLKAIAKGVRASKSKLAGGIELFAENQLTLLEGKGDLYTLVSSRMNEYFGDISKNIDSSMYAYECLKLINKLAPDRAGEEYYESLRCLLKSLSEGKIPLAQIRIWYGLELLEIMGVSPNLKTDNKNKPLSENGNYEYDFDRQCFYQKPSGSYGAEHVKILRFMNEKSRPVEIKGINQQVEESIGRLVNLIVNSQTS